VCLCLSPFLSIYAIRNSSKKSMTKWREEVLVPRPVSSALCLQVCMCVRACACVCERERKRVSVYMCLHIYNVYIYV